MLGGSIKIGARPFWGIGQGRVCFGDFKYQHWLPEIAYPAFNRLNITDPYNAPGVLLTYISIKEQTCFLTCSILISTSTFPHPTPETL